MAVTKVASLSNSVQTKYEDQYLLHAAENPGVWGQFIDWKEPIPETGGGASSFNWTVYGETDLVDSALTEDLDVQPDIIGPESSVTVTPNEYGKAFALTKKAKYQSRTNLPQLMGKLLDMNRINSIDRILRRGACGHGATRPTLTMHIDGSTTMASLTAASGTDNISLAFIEELAMQAMAMGIEPFKGAGFVAPVHPLFFKDLMALTEVRYVGYYQDEMKMFGSLEKPFTVRGITFLPSNMGRIYLGAGTAVQAATTLSAAANKGATTIAVADATGLAAGDWITVGTLETESVSPGSNLEQMRITGVDSLTLTIQANGVGENFGLRYNHAASESVVEAYNVAAIPLIGANSIIGAYGSDCGKYGDPIYTPPQDYLKRLETWGWYWYGGVGLVQKHILLGKCAVSKWTWGSN